MKTFFDFELDRLDGGKDLLGSLKGKVVLAVNVASKCGLTPQYTGLEELHEELAEENFSVVGFPCNQFGGQEPGSAKEIQLFCAANYGVTFPMSAKLEVNGAGRHPVELREVPDRPRRQAPEALRADHEAARQGPDTGHRQRALSRAPATKATFPSCFFA